MALSEEQVRHVARLARLGLSDAEVATFRTQLAEILDYAEQVGEVATDAVPPMTHPARPANVLRADEPVDGLAPDEALAPAPAAEDDRFRVPRIVGDERAAGPAGGDAPAPQEAPAQHEEGSR